jgi:hypothetical protein
MFVRRRGRSHQLIQGYREGGRVRQRIIANLGPHPSVEAAAAADPQRFGHLLRGDPVVSDVVPDADLRWAASELRRIYDEGTEEDRATEQPEETPQAFVLRLSDQRDGLVPILCTLMGLPRDPWPGLTYADIARMTKRRQGEAKKRGLWSYGDYDWEVDNASLKLRCATHREWLEGIDEVPRR